MAPTVPAPSGSTVTTVWSAPRVPSDASILPPARDAVTDDDCPECENTGRVCEGMFGGKVVYVSGCPECGREGRS